MTLAEDPPVAATIQPDAKTFAYHLFRALPDSVTGLRLLHLMAHPPRILWPRNVLITHHRISGQTSGQSASVWVLRPKTQPHDLPVVLHLHGGGYAIGTPQQDFHLLASLMSVTPSIFVVPAYQRSLQSPFPAALEDAVAALQWTARAAAEFGGDKSRIFVMGTSAGGGLAASLCHWALESHGASISGQYLIAAMLDDRTGRPASGAPLDGTLPEWSWAPSRNSIAWDLYLSGSNAEALSSEAVPARRENLSGLPPAYGLVGAADLFQAENSRYFARLAQDGVASCLTVVPHAYHGIEVLAPRSLAGRVFLSALKTGFERMLAAGSASAPTDKCLSQNDACQRERHDPQD